MNSLLPAGVRQGRRVGTVFVRDFSEKSEAEVEKERHYWEPNG